MFSFHTTSETFENATITGGRTLECTREHAHSKVLVEPTWLTALLFPFIFLIISGRHFGFVFEEDSGRQSRDYRDVIVFEKLPFQYVFSPN